MVGAWAKIVIQKYDVAIAGAGKILSSEIYGCTVYLSLIVTFTSAACQESCEASAIHKAAKSN